MKLFLASYFKEVAELLPDFYGDDPRGKKVIFIPTAAKEKLVLYVKADRKALEDIGFEVEDLKISKASHEEIEKKIAETDVVFVSGGNVFYLLQELRRKGADKILRDFIKSGKLYIGSSAGSIICSPNIGYVRDIYNLAAVPDLNDDFSGLNVINFYILPHYGNFPFVNTTKRILTEYDGEEEVEMKAISDNQVIAILDGKRRLWSQKKPNIAFPEQAKEGKLIQFRDPDLETSGKVIGFYPREFYTFDNFSSFAVDYQGRNYPTAEHAYQAAKFWQTAPELAEKIASARSAHETYKLAKTNAYKHPDNWDEIKVSVMEEILRAKVSQNPYVAQKLREAKISGLEIIEDSPKDDFWGWGSNRDGRNELGKLWMKLRDELEEENDRNLELN
ncbi:MAG: Type 1 glutamine amidotransferase-like domain-containing protein [Candidatus Nomurabacteria bacterium]|nr:Type 1 glutamine amidotransferase-like domain-containing protein [Candidatus Nomurabacteria bacterium]